ncbi:hypothetical protein IPJ72_01895 [Candidatus Peregrinibacteria bacterium]|nr:MAG: hypothetical protein IPJ72_01895 [Candidatus Peregrinibacteria bacterium]
MWLLVGFIVLMIADQVALIFNPEASTSAELIPLQQARNEVLDVVRYLKWLFSAVVTIFITISAVRLVTAGGEEDTLTTEKRHLTWGGIGLLVILLANNIVSSFYVIRDTAQGSDAQAAGAETALTQMAGLIRLLLIFLGPIAVLFTIYAGFLYLSALDDDENTGKAKKLIVAGVTAIVIVYAAYALVNTFLSAPLVPTA